LLYSKTPGIKQLINAYNKTGSSILGVQKVPKQYVHKYGIVVPKTTINDRLFEITGAVEKPVVEEAPSQHAIIGRYLFTGEFMNMLGNLDYQEGIEMNLIDAFSELMEKEKLFAYDIDAIRYDLGSKEGFVKATIDYALRDADIKEEITKFLKNKSI
jgi:UTP--glucose-1-phosphate uridylyltransferase